MPLPISWLRVGASEATGKWVVAEQRVPRLLSHQLTETAGHVRTGCRPLR